MEPAFFKMIAALLIVTSVYSFDSSAQTSTIYTKGGRAFNLDGKITSAVRSNLASTLGQIKNRGSDQFSGVDLQELSERVRNVKVGLVVAGSELVGSGYRNGGINLPEEAVVLINKKQADTYTAASNGLLQWHEALGATGYNDDNYLLSTSLVSQGYSKAPPLNPTLRERMVRQFNEERVTKNKVYKSIDGGATGVGGGGDGDIARIKMMFLLAMNSAAANGRLGDTEATEKILNTAVDTPIESAEFIESYKDVKKYKDLLFGINKYELKITILVTPSQLGNEINDSYSELMKQLFTIVSLLAKD